MDIIQMSKKELKQAEIISKVISKDLSQSKAILMLKISINLSYGFMP